MGGPGLEQAQCLGDELHSGCRGGEAPLLGPVLTELAVGALQIAPVFEGKFKARTESLVGVELVPFTWTRVEPGQGKDVFHDARVVGLGLAGSAPDGDVDGAAVGAIGLDAVGNARQISEVVGHVEVGVGEIGGMKA